MQSSFTVKIIDGLYLGDQITARDQQFLLLNHVALIVNMSGSYLPNYYQHYDIDYANLDWRQVGQKWKELCSQIQEVRSNGEVVALHGRDNLQGPACLSSLYLMHKFRWSLFKTLEYMQSRIEGLTFSPESFQLLKTAEIDLLGEDTKLSYNWQLRPTNSEELIVRNTFLNCREGRKDSQKSKHQPRPSAILKSLPSDRKQNRRISWKLTPPSTPASSLRQLNHNEQQSNLRNRIIMSVRKIVSDSTKKQHQINYNKSKQNCSAQKQNQTTPSLKKHKSTYTFISLKSMQDSEMKAIASTESLRPTEKQRTNLKEKNSQRLLTERIHTLQDSSTNLKKEAKIKTEADDSNGKVVIDIRIPKRTEHFSSCKSFAMKKKENDVAAKAPLTRFNFKSPDRLFTQPGQAERAPKEGLKVILKGSTRVPDLDVSSTPNNQPTLVSCKSLRSPSSQNPTSGFSQ